MLEKLEQINQLEKFEKEPTLGQKLFEMLTGKWLQAKINNLYIKHPDPQYDSEDSRKMAKNISSNFGQEFNPAYTDSVLEEIKALEKAGKTDMQTICGMVLYAISYQQSRTQQTPEVASQMNVIITQLINFGPKFWTEFINYYEIFSFDFNPFLAELTDCRKLQLEQIEENPTNDFSIPNLQRFASFIDTLTPENPKNDELIINKAQELQLSSLVHFSYFTPQPDYKIDYTELRYSILNFLIYRVFERTELPKLSYHQDNQYDFNIIRNNWLYDFLQKVYPNWNFNAEFGSLASPVTLKYFGKAESLFEEYQHLRNGFLEALNYFLYQNQNSNEPNIQPSSRNFSYGLSSFHDLVAEINHPNFRQRYNISDFNFKELNQKVIQLDKLEQDLKTDAQGIKRNLGMSKNLKMDTQNERQTVATLQIQIKNLNQFWGENVQEIIESKQKMEQVRAKQKTTAFIEFLAVNNILGLEKIQFKGLTVAPVVIKNRKVTSTIPVEFGDTNGEKIELENLPRGFEMQALIIMDANENLINKNSQQANSTIDLDPYLTVNIDSLYPSFYCSYGSKKRKDIGGVENEVAFLGFVNENFYLSLQGSFDKLDGAYKYMNAVLEKTPLSPRFMMDNISAILKMGNGEYEKIVEERKQEFTKLFEKLTDPSFILLPNSSLVAKQMEQTILNLDPNNDPTQFLQTQLKVADINARMGGQENNNLLKNWNGSYDLQDSSSDSTKNFTPLFQFSHFYYPEFLISHNSQINCLGNAPQKNRR